MPHNIPLAQRKRDYWMTGHQDCANVFDSDDVPTADELRKAFDYAGGVDPDDEPHKDVLREEWVRGWLERANDYLETERREREAYRARYGEDD